MVKTDGWLRALCTLADGRIDKRTDKLRLIDIISKTDVADGGSKCVVTQCWLLDNDGSQ